ncbi:LysM peptidoglycan-binding domain-containing protein [Burkholderia stagnalis]|uniref:LysM peptidoglycan-binding domain-containing protein n=1 Tax=Burkholderia stagnalis TaxID=1503054 RepID=UPI000F602DEB|nr:LysM peptidoglycan-binding domain-containing protein [Burkholderia stagnalis]RQY32502.1 LysM peptidoglycan-binding domain-containing protein [Burkholderia stagnalis]
MVAIVTGQGLGLQMSSALGLGNSGVLGNASFGQSGERIYVNAANGNLMLQDRDQLLLGRGVNGAIYRAYNSMGQLTGDGWQSGTTRSVGSLSGALNSVGSTVTLTDWDGSQTVFKYDAASAAYVSTAQSGVSVTDGANGGASVAAPSSSRATLAFDAASNAWVWRDGQQRLTERYGAQGRVVESRDRDGNATTYTYDANGRLATVTTSGGDVTTLDYDAAGRLSALRTSYHQESGPDKLATTVRYAYDEQGRLSVVTVDLTPEDNSVADGKVYTTKYAYDGASSRIASLTQSDGSKLSFTYVQVGADWRVATIAQAADSGVVRVTSLNYDAARRQTTVTDPLGNVQVLSYDDAGRLTQTRAKVSGGQTKDTRYQYDDTGNLARLETPNGRVLVLTYDPTGNLSGTRETQDGAEIARVERRYGTDNLLLSEAVYGSGAATGSVTRYAYDSAGHLRYTVSAAGRVTEYRYNAIGQRVSEIHYRSGAYDTGMLKDDAPVTLASLDSWVKDSARLDQAVRVDTTYDFRGNVAGETRYETLQSDGTAGGGIAQVRYIYDGAGRLLQRYVGQPGREVVEQFTYDGLGRILSATGFDQSVTTYQYDDVQHTVAVTYANGLLRTSTYNAAGELVAVTDTSQGRVLSQRKNAYDADGRLRMVTDEDGRITNYLYNEVGQRTATIGPDGTVTEYQYGSKQDSTIRTLTYATRLNAAQLATLVGASGKPVERTPSGQAASLDSLGLRPSTTEQDRVSWNGYLPPPNQLTRVEIDADEDVTRFDYDPQGRLLTQTVYSNRASVELRAQTLGATPDGGQALNLPAADPQQDRTTRYFYDRDGLLRGSVDAQGYLTEHHYNGAGERIETVRYADPVDAAQAANGTFAEMIPVAGVRDSHLRYAYNARGLLSVEIDAEGYVTRYRYDAAGNVIERTRGEQITMMPVDKALLSLPVTFLASGAVGTVVDVWVDGRKMGSVTLDDAGFKTYSITATDLKQLEGHTVDFRRASTGETVSVREVRLNDVALSRNIGQPDIRGSRPVVEASFMLEPAVLLATAKPLGQVEQTTYSYDAMNRLLGRTTSAVTGTSAATYTYDKMGRVVSQTVAGRTTNNRYDLQGRLVAQLTGEGSAALAALGSNPARAAIDGVWTQWGVSYAYDAAGLRVSMTDANKLTTLYYYDTNGNVVNVVNPAGEVVGHRRDAFGNIEQTTVYAVRLPDATLSKLKGGLITADLAKTFAALDNADASRTRFSYSAAGRLIKQVDPMGFATDFNYDAFGEVKSRLQDVANGVRQVIEYDYDRVGHQVRQAMDPTGLNLITKAVYDAFGRLVQSVDANGVVRSTEYDRNGRKVVVKDGIGQARMTYDAFDNILTRTDRLGNVTRYAYDAKNRQISITTPEGIVSKTNYNETGQVIAIIDGRGNTVTHEYDRDGRLVKTSDTAKFHAYRYDASGRMVGESDSRGMNFWYEFDAAGRVFSRMDLSKAGTERTPNTRYEFDAKGQQIRTTDPTGVVTDTRYDLNGHAITVISDPNGLKLSTTFTYDATGKVLTTTEGAGTASEKVTRNIYDSAGRLIERTVDPAGLSIKTRYAYDGVGNMVAETNALGGVTHYVYDAEGRQTWQVGPAGTAVHYERDVEGRILTREAFAIPLDVTALPEKLTQAQLSGLITRSNRDEVEYSVYDRDGRMRYAINALGYVKEQVYDASGNVIRTIDYGGPINVSSRMTPQAVANELAKLDDAARAATRITRAIYDSANRLAATIDAAGSVTRIFDYQYGNRTERLQYVTRYTANDDPDLNTLVNVLNSWSRNPIEGSNWRYSKTFYDTGDRVRFTVDALGYVTENRYDSAGRLAQTIYYGGPNPDALNASGVEQLAKIITVSAWGPQYRYDGAGRLCETIDANGTSTRYELDALGRAVNTVVAPGTSQQSTTHAVYDLAGNLIEKTQAYGTAQATTTRYAYDAAGRQIAATDARGVELAQQDTTWALAERQARGLVDKAGKALTAAQLSEDQKHVLQQAYTSTQSYDSAGRLIEKVDALHNTTRYRYDAFGNQVVVTDPLSATTVKFYDKLNRLIAQVSPDNWVVGTQYNSFGEVTQVTDYRLARPGVLDNAWKLDGWKSDPSQVLPPNDSADAVTRMEYDKAGRLIKSIDAEGHAESYEYNVLGDRTRRTNKLGGVFTYTYDRRGLLVTETLPVTSGGNPVVNRYQYDYRKNVTSVTRAGGLLEQTTTSYSYDMLGRRNAEMTSAVSGTTVTQVSSMTCNYDARGNLILQRDANGNVTKWYYDAANRRTGEVGPTGTLTLWKYDAAGNVTSTCVFGDPVKPTEGSQPPAPVDPSNVRETRSVYDASGRLIESRVINIATGYFDPTAGEDQRGEYFITSGSELVTRWEYDGRGAMIAKTDPAGGRTLYFYNGSGKKTLEIDAKGFGIAYTLNERGDVTREIRFAKPYPDPVTANPSLGPSIIASWPRSDDDRVTEYTWDRNGRKTSETRLNVQFATVDGNGKLAQSFGKATTQYAYDGEGHLLRKVDANGQEYGFQYDAVGRQTAQILPQFADYKGRLVRTTTTFTYDGVDNVISESVSAGDGTPNHVYTYTYYRNTKFVEHVTDQQGQATYYSYDLAGNVTQTRIAYRDADGVERQLNTDIRYDASNREVARSTSAVGRTSGTPNLTGTSIELRYNAYGELTGRRTNGGGPNGEWQEYTDYNNAGWVVRSNFNDGISHLYMHDRNGNATLKVESMGTDLRGLVVSTGQDLEKLLQRTDMMQTFTRYDARNQVIQIRQPKTSGSVPRISFSPVDIPIDGGVFANTQLSIGGWIEKRNRPVPGPAQPIESGSIIAGSTAGIGPAAFALNWTPIGLGPGKSYSIDSIDLRLQDLSGEYNLEARVSWELTEDNGNAPRVGNLTSVLPSSGGAAKIPLGLESIQGFVLGTKFLTNIQFKYKLDIYATLKGGGSSAELVGSTDQKIDLVMPVSGSPQIGNPARTEESLVYLSVPTSQMVFPQRAMVGLNWTPHGMWMAVPFTINSIDLALPDLKGRYGAYDLEARVSWQVGDTSYKPERGNLTTVLPSDGGSATIPIHRVFERFPNDAFFEYTVEFYAKSKSGNGPPEMIGSTTQRVSMLNIVDDRTVFTPRKDGDAFFELRTPKDKFTLAQHSLPDGARGALYYRPAGSNSTFQRLEKDPGSQPNSFSVDLAGLPDGDYEMVFMAVSDGSDGREAGTLLRRDGYRAHVEHSGSSTMTPEPIPVDQESSRAGFLADASGNYIWTSPRTLNLFSARDSALHLADHVIVKVRQQGATTWNEERTLWRDPVTGAFAIDLSGYTPGNLDLQIDLYAASGQKLDTTIGTVGLSGDQASPSFSIGYLADLKSTVVFHSQPADTDYIMVSWEQNGTTHYERVTRLGNGEFTWDVKASGMVPQPGQPYAYAIKYTAYDAAGQPVAMGAGDISVGMAGNMQVTLKGSERPSMFEFKPTGSDGKPLAEATELVLYYRQSTLKDHAYDRPFTEVTLKRDASGRFIFDASALSTRAEFEYRYVAKDTNGKVLSERQSYFLTGTRNNPVTNVDIVGVIDQTAKDMTIDRLQQHNAFREVSAERDGRGNWTASSYNTMGLLTLKREPRVSVTLANGAKIEVEPEARFYYDLTGNLIGMKDANGNLMTQQWNFGTAKPTVAKSWDALGYSKVSQYDGFGNLRTTLDELGRRTDYIYDARNRLIEVDRPVLANGKRSIDRYEYDALDRRVAHVDALGGRERTYYDADGRITKTVSAAGRTVQYDYRWASNIRSLGTAAMGGWARTMTNANGMKTVDETDQFGRVTQHTDLGGHVFQYTYNWAGLVTKQTGTSGQNVDYSYYSNGLVRSIVDNATKTQSLYEYDGDGNRTAEYFSNFGDSYVFAQSRVKYDALNRVTAIEDDSYKVYYEYDAVGNRRRMLAKYTDLVGHHERTQDYWYEYDALNRFTVSMGSLSAAPATDPNDKNVRIVNGARGEEGVQLGYNAAGERVLATYAKDGRTERYTYDANGYLETQSVNDIVVQQRTNDLLGRVTGTVERDAATGKVVTSVERSWDADSIQKQERDNLNRVTSVYTRMADGTLTRVETNPDDASNTRTVSTYTYEWWDSAKQSQITTQASNPNAPGWRPASSYFNYDANGNLKSTYDDGGNDPGKARAFQYWTDLRGQVQRRDELRGVSVDANGRIMGAEGDRKHNYYYLNGNRVGNQGNDGIDRVDYMQELAGKLGKGSENQYRVFTPVSTADFDENYMAINGVYPATSPGQWTVRDGETLKSIASALWGDSSLWYILADANGLKGGDELRPGQLLTVPNKVTNVHNTSTTFKPYDPGKAIGDTQPTLPAPPPPPGPGGCGGFLSIIAIVVAVVVTVYTAGATSGLLGVTATGAGATAGSGLGSLGVATLSGSVTGGALGAASGVVAAGVGGTVGALASQGVMVAAGQQRGLDWGGVALSAFSAGSMSALGGSSAMAAVKSGLGQTGSAVASGAARSVITQGLGVITGAQRSFDWTGVAASAIAAGAGSAVGQTALGQTPFIGSVASGVTAGAASTLVRGGSLSRDIGAIAADAVASTVGNMVVDQVQGASVGKTTATPMHPDDAQFLGALTGAIEAYSNTPSSYAGAQFAGPGAVPLDAINVTASGSTSGLGALYGTGYDGAFAAWSDDTRLNLNDAAFRSAMPGATSAPWNPPVLVNSSYGEIKSLPLSVRDRLADPSVANTPGGAILGFAYNAVENLVGNTAALFSPYGLNPVSGEMLSPGQLQRAKEDFAINVGASLIGAGEAGALLKQSGQSILRSAGEVAGPVLEQRGLSKLALPRTPDLGPTSTTAELLQTGAIPGREGVVLSQPNVVFSDLWRLSDNSGVEFLLTRENGQFVLRSGSPTSAPIPGGVRPIVHTHPLDADGINSLLPSRADINVLNDYWARNPSIQRPVSQIITGPNQTTIFRATGLDPWTRGVMK